MELKKKKDDEKKSTDKSKKRKRQVTVRLRQRIEELFLFRSNVYKHIESRRKKTISFFSLATSKFCKRQLHRPSANDMFYLSLYNEGLLKHKVMTQEENGKTSYVGIAFEYPVLNICYGFEDFDLIEYDNNHFLAADFPSMAAANGPNAWHKTVLHKRIPFPKESLVEGLPVSVWLEVMEPTVAALIRSKKAGRHKRTNITKHKKPSPLHRDRHVIIGDVQQTYFIVGPHQHHPANMRFGIVAIFAHRLAELGERHWRRENRFTPTVTRVIPLMREHRESTRNRPPRQEPVPSWRVRRSKSAPELNITFSDSHDADDMIHELARIQWNRYMVFH